MLEVQGRTAPLQSAQRVKVVERVPIIAGFNPWSERYLKSKKDKMGHML